MPTALEGPPRGRTFDPTVEGVPEPPGWRTAFFHPRTGWIAALGGLRFFEAHCEHHLRQIDRLLAVRDFPR